MRKKTCGAVVAKLFVFICFFACLVSVSSNCLAEQASVPVPRHVIAIVPADAPPTSFQDGKTGRASGFAVEIMDVLAERAGLQVEYMFGESWQDIIWKVEKGQADVAPVIGVSEARRKSLAFTEIIDSYVIAFFVHSHEAEKRWIPEGKTVGVIAGSVAHEELRSRPNIAFLIYGSLQLGMHDLLSGKIDAFACPAPIFLQIARDAGLEDHFEMIDPPIDTIRRAIAVNKDKPELLSKLNTALTGFAGSEEYGHIYGKWYGTPPSPWTTRRIIAASIAVVLLSVVTMAIWRYLSVVRLNRALAASLEVRRQAEEALRQAKEEWERTFDAISDPVMILDTGYRIVKANRSMAEALGVTPEAAVGMTCFSSVHGTSAPPSCCPHAKLLRDGLPCSQEIYEPRLGGHYLISVSPLHAPDGSLIGSIHAARDISFQKKAEEVVLQYSKDLEALLVLSRDMTLAADPHVIYRAVVHVAKDLLAFDYCSLLLLSEDGTKLAVHDCLGWPESMIGTFSLMKGVGLSTHVAQTKKAGTVSDFLTEARFEVPAVVFEKKIRSAIAVPMMMRDEVIGVLIGHTLAARDFSEEETKTFQHIANSAAVAIQNRLNSEKLRTSEKAIRDIAESLGEGLYVINHEGLVTFVNPEAERLLEWTEAELKGKNIHHIVHSRRPDGTYLAFEDCPMHAVSKTGRRFMSRDEVFTSKGGRTFPVSLISTPLTEEGSVVGSVTSFRDISERKQLEQEREHLIANLQKALAEIRTLQGILPICSYCKKIRDDKGAWTQMEAYISGRTDALFSHGICLECAKKHFPEAYGTIENSRDDRDGGNA